MHIKTAIAAAAAIAIAQLAIAQSAHESSSGKLNESIPTQSLADALKTLGAQTNTNILADPQLIDGKQAPAIKPNLTVDQAMTELLKGTGLTYRFLNERTVVLAASTSTTANLPSPATGEGRGVRDDGKVRLVQVQTRSTEGATDHKDPSPTPDTKSEDAQLKEFDLKGIPEILVRGSRSSNADIARTEDDVQPYVVFGREEIERSQATVLEDFLRTRLPMNTASGSNRQGLGSRAPSSSINLRGLGPGQTLILVDGRRMPNISLGGAFEQPDINGIPLAAIERIEVLPATAGAIYGGGATGGAVNIVLKRDYRGFDVQAAYGNTFDSDVSDRRLDVNAGFTLEGGRTRIMLSASHSNSNLLTVGDRDFATRGRALQFTNDPGVFTNAFFPPNGDALNIQSLGGGFTLDDDYGGGTLGTAIITNVPLGYDVGSDNGALFAANAGTYNLDLPDDLRGRQQSLLTAPKMDSATVNLRREFGGRGEAFIDLSRLSNQGGGRNYAISNLIAFLPGDAPNNPFLEPIRMSFPLPGLGSDSHGEVETLRGLSGLIVRLPHDWSAAAEHSWSRSRSKSNTAGPAVDGAGLLSLRTGLPAADGRPALDVFSFPIDFTPYLVSKEVGIEGPRDTILRDTTLRFSGPLLHLPGGPVTVSTLFEHRVDSLRDAIGQALNTNTLDYNFYFSPHASQKVDSGYLEVQVPLLRQLQLQASVRHDRYETQGPPLDTGAIPVPSRDDLPELDYATSRVSSNSYLLGLRYAPTKDVIIRASFATGFLPPSVNLIASNILDYTPFLPFGVFVDPKRGGINGPGVGGEVDEDGAPFPLVERYGGTPQLRPEKSESFSTGVVLTPRFLPGLRLSVDYTRIRKTDEVGGVTEQYILDHEDQFEGRITRLPLTPADEALGYTAGVVTQIDATLVNITKTDVDAYDIQLDYELPTRRFGLFHPYVVATRQPHYQNRILPDSDLIDSVGFLSGPLKWRGNLGLSWKEGPWSFDWNAQIYDSYRIYAADASEVSIETAVRNQGAETIRSQIYHDATVAYVFDQGHFSHSVLQGVDVRFGIQNVFDKSPPIIATDGSAAGYSTYGDPRLRRFSLGIRKRFGHGK